jgi:hypothetical protein
MLFAHRGTSNGWDARLANEVALFACESEASNGGKSA